jgi:hypothetical protein
LRGLFIAAAGGVLFECFKVTSAQFVLGSGIEVQIISAMCKVFGRNAAE